MNSTNKMLMIAAITSLLVMGTSLVQMKSFAGGDEHEKNGDFKSSVKASFESDEKSAKQHLDQDNFCYRGDNCKQANQGQQIVGEDNDAKGFNDQSFNLEESEDSTDSTDPKDPHDSTDSTDSTG
jgi:hypothetical protein